MLNALKIRTWTGEEKQVKKIVFFPEKDENGEVFYKIEGWNNESCFMVEYSYTREKVWTRYIELLQSLVEFQAKELEIS